jgi:2-hydroxychromene-2-carboxylate isomerase
MRLEGMERSHHISFRWRTFHLLLILQEMKHVPFADKPAKCQYMWRDTERRTTMYCLHAILPAPYPVKNSAAANCVAIVGMREGWGPDFVRAAYRRWFQQGVESGSEPNLSLSLRGVGQNPDRVLALAKAAEANDLLLAETETAKHLGIFGSPTFAVGDEIFWGDDRLEDAISWHKHGQVRGGRINIYPSGMPALPSPSA